MKNEGHLANLRIYVMIQAVFFSRKIRLNSLWPFFLVAADLSVARHCVYNDLGESKLLLVARDWETSHFVPTHSIPPNLCCFTVLLEEKSLAWASFFLWCCSVSIELSLEKVHVKNCWLCTWLLMPSYNCCLGVLKTSVELLRSPSQ